MNAFQDTLVDDQEKHYLELCVCMKGSVTQKLSKNRQIGKLLSNFSLRLLLYLFNTELIQSLVSNDLGNCRFVRLDESDERII